MTPAHSFLHRRDFLGRVALGALATTIPAFGALPLPAQRSLRLDSVKLQDFSPHLQTKFFLYTDAAGPLVLRLVEAAPLSGGGARPAHLSGRAPFSLVYQAPPGCTLEQRIYRLSHPALGSFEIFLVPIGSQANGLLLEAVFN